MKILHLTLKSRWYDMIASGEKKEEYRETKLFWLNRFFKPSYSISNEDYYPEEMLNELIKFPEQDIDAVLNLFCARRVKFDAVCFARGGHFHPSIPQMTVVCNEIKIGTGKPEWGAEEGKEYFVIKLGEILKSDTLIK